MDWLFATTVEHHLGTILIIVIVASVDVLDFFFIMIFMDLDFCLLQFRITTLWIIILIYMELSFAPVSACLLGDE